MSKLNETIAVAKETKSRAYGRVTELHNKSKKPELFTGFSRTFRKKADDGEDFPPESKAVQETAARMLWDLGRQLEPVFDSEAAICWANCQAKADVEVDGQPVLVGVPVTYLLFMEKQLNDVRTFVEALPVLDAAEQWTMDSNSGLYASAPSEAHRTKKVNKPIVLYPATVEHPAQTQLVQEEELIGWWRTTKLSGGIPATQRERILDRVNALARAVKFARERANGIDAAGVFVGKKIMGYLLKGEDAKQ